MSEIYIKEVKHYFTRQQIIHFILNHPMRDTLIADLAIFAEEIDTQNAKMREEMVPSAAAKDLDDMTPAEYTAWASGALF